MFLNKRIMKKMLKRGYNTSGAWAGRTLFQFQEDDEARECFFLYTGTFMAMIDKRCIGKDTLAAIVELCGDLPQEHDLFKAQKGEPTQLEIWSDYLLETIRRRPESMDIFMKTGITIEAGGKRLRVFQEQVASRQIRLVDECYVSMIDHEAIDAQLETLPEGPYIGADGGSLCYWMNNACVFACVQVPLPEQGKESESGLARLVRHMEGTWIEI